MIEYLQKFTPCLEQSFFQYHVPEITYFNLITEPNFRLKLYFIRKPKDREYLVSPHSHKYNFYTEVLSGEVQNCLFDEIDSMGQYSNAQRNYVSDLGNFDENQISRNCFLQPSKYWPAYLPVSGYYMDYRQIHTLKILSDTVILLLREYRKEAVNSCLYTVDKTSLRVAVPPVYKKFTSKEEMIDSYCSVLEQISFESFNQARKVGV